MNFKVTNGNNKKLLLINVPENQKDTLLKSFENFSIEEISNKEVDELRRGGIVMETTKMITTPPIYGDFFLPNDYEKTTNFEKPRTIKRNWESPYKYHR